MPAADILLKEPIPWVPGLEGSYPGEESYVELGKARVRMVFCWCPPWDGKPAFGPWTGPGFWLAKYPVTQDQWVAVMGSNPSHFKLGGMHPVDSVSWHDAQDFCTRTQMRLPLAEEWDHACMGRQRKPFGVGNGSVLTSQVANFDGGSPDGPGEDAFKWLCREQTLQVGCFPESEWGLCDIHGQLWEWCGDDVDESGLRVLRGGSWFNSGGLAASGDRGCCDSGDRASNFGFRPCPSSISQSAIQQEGLAGPQSKRGTSERGARRSLIR
jgi:formylglycine-generating enzyme required for sulfatase activity